MLANTLTSTEWKACWLGCGKVSSSHIPAWWETWQSLTDALILASDTPPPTPSPPTMRSTWAGKAGDDAKLAPTERSQGYLWALHNGSFHVIVFSQAWCSSHQTNPFHTKRSWIVMATAPAKKWISNSSVMDFFFFFWVPKEIKAWTEWACHHIMLASWPPASQSSVCWSPWWPPAAKRGFVHSVCKGKVGEKWFWARKESGAELSRLSKEAMLTLKLSHPRLMHPVSRLRLRRVQNSSLFILARRREHVKQVSR